MNVQQKIAAARTERRLPVWLQDIETGLPVRSQFILSGNTRDLYLMANGAQPAFPPMAEALWSVLAAKGYAGLLRYDPVEGTVLHHECDPSVQPRLAEAGIELGAAPRDLAALAGQLRLVAAHADLPVAFLLDYASQLCGREPELDPAERDFFIACDKIARATGPLSARGRPARLRYNPIIWLVDRPNDLPDWFTIGNEAIRKVAVPLPDLEERFALALSLLPHFPGAAKLPAEKARPDLEKLSLQSDGLTLRGMLAVHELARAQGIGLDRIADAIRAYRIGTPRNPWKTEVMRRRITDGEKLLTDRVKGQDHAVRNALDILTRSVMGLSGSQTSSRQGRPRGVMFFAGPTGVGKTELAKAITELLFGDEAAYHRFDMSEFNVETSESRLVGAPPGYVGHDQGGELVNAARARPFSVFLFDEIEKAHPRILDKFLQIIDEGRLTDGRGETVHFSESLIIFTSNIGMFGDDRAMNMSLNILPSDSYDEIERKIVEAIRKYFRFELKRPELINRIGRNIVVFEFIRARSAAQIVRGMVKKVLDAVHEEHGIEVVLSDRMMNRIEEHCTYDLFDGGRGIGNRIETVLVNPLARLLFGNPDTACDKLRIAAFEERNGEYQLRVRCACETPEPHDKLSSPQR